MKGLGLAILGAAVLIMLAGSRARAVDLAQTPAPVQTAIHAQVGDGKVGDIDRTNQDGETTFDVSFTTKAGDEHSFTVADDGTVLSVLVELADTPAAVKKAISVKAAGWELGDINKNLDDTEVTYEVSVSKAGREKSFTIGPDGELAGEDVSLAETPAAVQAAISGQVADGTLQSINKTFDADGNSFDVVATAKDDGRNAFSVGMDGRMLSVEVSLARVPPGARKTIEEKIAGGKILHINKSLLEKKDNVLPYEVTGRKGGKPFNFSVGPRGRFLGMDD